MKNKNYKKNDEIIIIREHNSNYLDLKKKYPSLCSSGIYFRLLFERNMTKIGKSMDILGRTNNAFTDIPDDSVRLIYFNCPRECLEAEEQMAHNFFASKFAHGEWFKNLTKSEIHQYVQMRKKEIDNEYPNENYNKIKKKTETVLERKKPIIVGQIDFDSNGVKHRVINEIRPKCFFRPYANAQITSKAGQYETYRSYYADEIGLSGKTTKQLLKSRSAYMGEGGRVRVYVCKDEHERIMDMRRKQREEKEEYINSLNDSQK